MVGVLHGGVDRTLMCLSIFSRIAPSSHSMEKMEQLPCFNSSRNLSREMHTGACSHARTQHAHDATNDGVVPDHINLPFKKWLGGGQGHAVGIDKWNRQIHRPQPLPTKVRNLPQAAKLPEQLQAVLRKVAHPRTRHQQCNHSFALAQKILLWGMCTRITGGKRKQACFSLEPAVGSKNVRVPFSAMPPLSNQWCGVVLFAGWTPFDL